MNDKERVPCHGEIEVVESRSSRKTERQKIPSRLYVGETQRPMEAETQAQTEQKSRLDRAEACHRRHDREAIDMIELTISYYCQNPQCISTTEQTETITIRRGQRKTLKCGLCEEVAVEIQANRRRESMGKGKKCGNCGQTLKKTTPDMTTSAPFYCEICGTPYNSDGTEFDDSVK